MRHMLMIQVQVTVEFLTVILPLSLNFLVPTNSSSGAESANLGSKVLVTWSLRRGK